MQDIGHSNAVGQDILLLSGDYVNNVCSVHKTKLEVWLSEDWGVLQENCLQRLTLEVWAEFCFHSCFRSFLGSVSKTKTSPPAVRPPL